MDVLIYLVEKTNGGRVVHITDSALEVEELLAPGYRVEVWKKGRKVDTIHTRTRQKLEGYKPISQNTDEALRVLKLLYKRGDLTVQQYKTLKGQVLAGDMEAATKGLYKLIRKGKNSDATDTRQGSGRSHREQPKD